MVALSRLCCLLHKRSALRTKCRNREPARSRSPESCSSCSRALRILEIVSCVVRTLFSNSRSWDLPCSREALQLHADGTNPGSALPPLAITRPKMLPSPLGDGVGHSNHDRFRGYLSVHLRSGLQFPCLRFATAVTGRHARLGTRLLARLCRGCHFRRLCLTSFQGATPTPPDVRVLPHPAPR